jgi:phasin family protein
MMTKSQDFTKSGFNFALFFAKTTFDGIERMALLNLAASRSVFETAMSNISALLGAKDVQAFVSLQKELASPSIEKGVEYSRNVIALDQLALAAATAATDFQAFALELAGRAIDDRHDVFQPSFARCRVDQLEATAFAEQADFFDIEDQRTSILGQAGDFTFRCWPAKTTGNSPSGKVMKALPALPRDSRSLP